jgi:predicted nucleotidyltransferase
MQYRYLDQTRNKIAFENPGKLTYWTSLRKLEVWLDSGHRGTKVHAPRKEIHDFCSRNHIVRLSLFGSVLTSNFGSESDIDVLVEFEPGRSPGFLGLAALEDELSALFGGRKVDLRTPRELSKYFRDEVIASAEVRYAAG